MHPRSDSPLSPEDRRALLERARQAIVHTVFFRTLPDLPLPQGRLAQPGGAFVTLRCLGRLRGCVGRTGVSDPLAETVAQCAITAALQDVRFKPLSTEDIASLQIEISVLSELWPVRHEEVELGIHGIVVERDGNRGLLLPQVAVEQNWGLTDFLEAACRKARLQTAAWRHPGTNLFAFTAEVFSELSCPLEIL